jgi:hypothetical protein
MIISRLTALRDGKEQPWETRFRQAPCCWPAVGGSGFSYLAE